MISAASVSTANRSRGVIPSDTAGGVRAPVNSRKYARTTAIPLRAAAATTARPTYGLASTAAVDQQLGRDEAERAGEPDARQARQQEADGQRRRVLVEAVVVGQREPAEAGFQRPQRQPEAAQREDHREPQRQAPGQLIAGVQLQPDQHERRVAQEQVGEEPPRLALDGRHPRGVDRRDQRTQPDAPQDPVRRDRQDEPDGGVDAAERGHEEQGVAERGVLEPVGHPAVGRDRAAADEDGQQEQGRRPGADAAASRPHRQPSHEQDDEQRHVQDVHPVGRPRWSSSTYGGTVLTREQADEHPGSLQLNVARRMASAASDQENENRRIFVRAVASAVRKWSRATSGTSRALSSSRAKNVRPNSAPKLTAVPGAAARVTRTRRSQARDAETRRSGERQAQREARVLVAQPADARRPIRAIAIASSSQGSRSEVHESCSNLSEVAVGPGVPSVAIRRDGWPPDPPGSRSSAAPGGRTSGRPGRTGRTT